MHKHVLGKPSMALAPGSTRPRDGDQKDNGDNDNHASQTAGTEETEKTEEGKISTSAQIEANMSQSKLTGPEEEIPISPAKTEDYMESLTPAITPKQHSLKSIMAEAKLVQTGTTEGDGVSNSVYFPKGASGITNPFMKVIEEQANHSKQR